jgi:hypothetical protein
MTSEFTKIFNNFFIEGKLNFKGEPNDNLEITLYSTENNLAYKCNFLDSNITVPNTNLEGIFKMVINTLDANQSYSIKWELKDFNFVITYNHDIFRFSQLFNFSQIDFSISQLKYQLFQSKQEVNELKQKIVTIEKYNELVNQIEDMKKIVETLKSDVNKLKEPVQKVSDPVECNVKTTN